jgi:hypothetical protein
MEKSCTLSQAKQLEEVVGTYWNSWAVANVLARSSACGRNTPGRGCEGRR